MIRICTLAFCIFTLNFISYGQTSGVKGIIVNAGNGLGIEGAIVSIQDEAARTPSNITGFFVINSATPGDKKLFITAEGFQDLYIDVTIPADQVVEIGEIKLTRKAASDLDDLSLLPTISLESTDSDIEGGGDADISSMLTASRDVFVATASFTFGPARFRIRGYNPEYTTLNLNGIAFNDMETGVPYFWQLGGLNDVLRARDINIGVAPVSYDFGDIGGVSNIDLRPSRQWKESRVSYALSNRSYQHRIMYTTNTGMMKNGWAFSFSGSRRWAQEAYNPGTFFDGWSYFLGAEKKINDRHSLSLVAFGAPTVRGGTSPVVQEMYDLAGTNYYNPNWGYQDGEKRNSRVSSAHLPMAILRHDFQINRRSNLVTAVSYQTGRNGFGALSWDNTNDPRPDYYQKLPSFQTNPETRDQLADALRNDENLRQLNWDYFYDVNRNNIVTVENAGGIPGNNVQGKLAKYFLEERRIDNSTLSFTSFYENFITDRFSLNAGVNFKHFTGHNFNSIQDLLGADFYLNEDRFARRDFPNDPSKWENDFNNPRQLLKEGDVFGYDYNTNIRQGGAWLQGTLKLRRWDLFAAANLNHDIYWRTGNVVNGRFPDNSFGDSEKINFTTYGVKGGITYKIDGRQYVYAHAFAGTRPPLYRNVFLSPRTRDQVNPYTQEEGILNGEIGYLFRSPYLKAKATVYYSRFSNQSNIVSYFQDDGVDFDLDGQNDGGGLVNFALNGVERTHTGVELALDYKLSATLSVTGVASLGDFIISNRPTAYITLDNNSAPIADGLLIYAKNFYVSRTPQQAGSIGLNYRSPRFWFLNVNVNYFDKIYLDFNPVRRTEQGILDVTPGSAEWEKILYQEKLPAAFTVDLFGGKSWRIKQNTLLLNVGIGNLLNNQTFATGGYEQLRFNFEDQNPDRFPPKYFYAQGLNYFVNITYRY